MKLLTKNRAELLGLFFTNPDRAFYMQEIGRILGKKPGTFQRALYNMAEEGILESEYKANARYFKANKKYFLYNELKSIVFKTVGIQGRIKTELKGNNKIEFCFIYGSFAKSKENYFSDIDLIIIGSPDEDELITRLDKLEKKLKRDINYKLYSIKDLIRENRNKEPFTQEVLKSKKIMLIGNENELQNIFER